MNVYMYIFQRWKQLALLGGQQRCANVDTTAESGKISKNDSGNR